MKKLKNKKMENKNTINYTQIALDSLKLIAEKEPEFFVAVAETLQHLSKTYKDKYEGSKELLDTKKLLYDKEKGGVINIYQVLRYAQRFLSEGFSKSHNKNDLYKMIHYTLFNIVRMNKLDTVLNADIVDSHNMSEEEFNQINIQELKK